MNPGDGNKGLEKKRPKLESLKGVKKEEPNQIDLRVDLISDDAFAQLSLKVFEQNLDDENVQIMGQLGQGSQAVVYKALYVPSNLVIALKKLFIKDKTELLMVQRELLFLATCSHPNIIRCFGIKAAENSMLISLEFMNMGPLSYVLNTEGALPEIITSIIINQVLKGIAYLHKEKKIIHRDIKPSNLLLNNKGEVKIADFGISRQVGGTEGKANTFLGTRLYMSPERLMGKDYQLNSDTWSIGLVTYQCVLGSFPFYEEVKKKNVLELKQFLYEGRLLQFPKNFSENLKSFLICCLQLEPEKRVKPVDLLEHPFIKAAQKVDIGLFQEWLVTVSKKAILKTQQQKKTDSK